MSCLTAGSRARSWRIGRWQRRFPVLQVVAVVVAYLVGVLTLPGLGTWQSTKLILVLGSLVGLAAIGQTLLILMGGFDLSIPGFIVAGSLTVTQVRERWDVGFAFSLVVALVVAGLLGSLGGYICHRFDINPLIVTLAVGTVALGLAQSQTLGGLTTGSGAPTAAISFASPSTHTFGIDIPPLVVTWLLVGIAVSVFLHRTVAGRHLLGTGANQEAAEYSLINTRRVWTATFAASAVISVLVGLAVAGFGGAITVESGAPYLFLSVVAVLVGGTIFGGPGDYLRTAVGALFITIVDVVLVGHGAGRAEQQIIYGATIIVAVSLYGRARRISERL